MKKIKIPSAKGSSGTQTIRTNEILRKLSQYSVLCVLVSCLLFCFTFTGLAQEASSGGAAKTDAVYAADFTLKDLTGKEHKLSDYKGRPIFLIFMTTWCKDCLASIPGMKAIYSRYHEKGLVMLSINIQESHEKAAAYAKKHNLPYPTLLDPEGTMSKRYGVGGVPVKVLIDRDGRFICWNCRSLESLIAKQFEATAK